MFQTAYQVYKRAIGRGSDEEAPPSWEDGELKNRDEKQDYSLNNGGFEHDVNDKDNGAARAVYTTTTM